MRLRGRQTNLEAGLVQSVTGRNQEDAPLNEAKQKPPRSLAARIVAAGFLAAFASSVATVIFTGLLVKAPRTEISAGLPNIEMTTDRYRSVNLVFTTRIAVDNVSLLLELPAGVELRHYEGRRRVQWRTELEAGKNVLPLELLASTATRGQLVAKLRHGANEKIFRVYVSAAPG